MLVPSLPNKCRERLGLDVACILPQMTAAFMTSLVQTARHGTAVLMTVLATFK